MERLEQYEKKFLTIVLVMESCYRKEISMGVLFHFRLNIWMGINIVSAASTAYFSSYHQGFCAQK